jgi:hypothetical protein
MKYRFLELASRLPALLALLLLTIKFLMDGEYLLLIVYWFGAWGWESVLFFLHREKILNVTKYWDKDENNENIQ